MTLDDTCDAFLNHCQSAISLSGHTLRAYGSDLRALQAHFHPTPPIDAIGKEELRRYIRHLREAKQLRESSIKRHLACTKLLFKWAQQEALIEHNPFDTLNERIRLPRRLPRALDTVDTAALLAAVSHHPASDSFNRLAEKTAIHLLMETGIRVGELANIALDDLSLTDHCIRILGKGNRQRFVYVLTPKLELALKHYSHLRVRIPSRTPHLFITSHGEAITPPKLRTALSLIKTSARIKAHITPHMLRHTCATRWLEAGLDIRHVQKLLGHHSISTTEIYTHVSDQSLRDALSRALAGGMR